MRFFPNKLIKRVILTSIFSILGGSFLFADQIAVQEFGYLNSNESSAIIDPKEAQDLLNVDVTPGGKSVKKRAGYGVYKQAFTTSAGIHGGYHAFDTTGNDVQIWASSVSVKGIVADGTPNTIVSSATVNSTLDCADSQGSIYCVNSSRDFYIRTDGATLTSWHTSPLGTMIESTPDRMVVAGVAASPNTLFVSQSNTFTNYTVGGLPTDAFTEVIAAPGSRLTHIRWGCQKLLWWKDQSFGYFDFDDQFSASVKIVSDNIGTFDNTSAIDPGGSVWFRGQDGHIYQYDCSGLTKQTIEITPQIQTSGRRTSNSWTQTSQSDWQSGDVLPTGQLSTTISAGEVVASSFSASEYSSASGWGSGTSSNFAVGTSSLSLAINNSGSITNPDFESAFSGNWTATTATESWDRDAIYNSMDCGGNISPQSGTGFAGCAPIGTVTSASFDAIDLSGNVLQTVAIPISNNCTWTQSSLPPSTSLGKRVKFRLHSVVSGGDNYLTTSDSYIWGGAITFYYNSGRKGTLGVVAVDNVQNGSSTITSGSFTSRTFDLGYSSAIYQISNINYTANTSTPTFSLITSVSPTGPWTQILTATGTNAYGNRYSKFVSSISIGSTDNALSFISSYTVIARSSGTYYSAWKNAPSLSAWSTFNPTFSDNGGSHTFYVRSSTSPQTVLNSTVAWVAQPVNAQIAASTGTYFQFRDDFLITAATNTPILSDFTANWFDGTASDQAYIHYFDNAIWASVAYGVGISSNNYIFKRDLINNGWTLYYFGANGMLTQNNRLFFGSVTDGNVYQFGSGTSDNGTAINAFWKSKDFQGADPFLQNQLSNIDVFSKQNTGQSLTSTYTTDTSTSTSYVINLSSSTQSIVQSRKLLPSGKLGYTFNIMLGDNTTTSAWEVLGLRIGYTQLPYRPSVP